MKCILKPPIQIDACLCKLKRTVYVISKVIYFRFGALGHAACFHVILFFCCPHCVFITVMQQTLEWEIRKPLNLNV